MGARMLLQRNEMHGFDLTSNTYHGATYRMLYTCKGSITFHPHGAALGRGRSGCSGVGSVLNLGTDAQGRDTRGVSQSQTWMRRSRLDLTPDVPP